MAAAIGLLLLAAAAAVRGHATRPPNASLISQSLFWELEELARVVDISYCVGTAGLGIQKPFRCASRCADRDFDTFELVTVSRIWPRVSRTVLTNTGLEHGALPV